MSKIEEEPKKDKKDMTPQELEQAERMERFEASKVIKSKELDAVLDFLKDKVGLKTHRGILLQRSNVEYFRGVNFHIGVLQANKHLLKLMPTFVKDGSITQLENMNDSIRLGQQMILYRNIIQLRKDPRIVQAGNEKAPKYIVPEKPMAPMTETGIYMLMEKESDKKTASIYLILMVVAVLALMCFRLWPLWLKKGIWYCSFYLLVFLVVTAVVRVILWGFFYHFGLEIWLFPNYWIDSNDPRDSFLPVWSYEAREDMMEFRSIIFRIISGSLCVYMIYQFCQDEQNIADLKDLSENGLSDLFEYGQEFMIGGNALGDGSKPKEEEKKEKTWQEKYRSELRKDIDDLGMDEEDLISADDTEDNSDMDHPDYQVDPVGEAVPETFDDEEEFVSSKDMFNDM